MYWLLLLAGALFLGWADTHTDEIPILLGFTGIAATVVGGIFPSRSLLTGAVFGSILFVAESLVHFGLLNAPYPPGPRLPWEALTAFVPAGLGATLGYLLRRMK